jgi:hypothetical protein
MAKRARKPVRKLTKLQRREKYTKQARDRRQKRQTRELNKRTDTTPAHSMCVGKKLSEHKENPQRSKKDE